MWFYRLPGSLMRDSFSSIVGVQVGSAWCLLCLCGAQGRDRPTDTGLETCRLLGSERLAEVPSDPQGVPLAWPLAPGLAAPAAPITTWFQAQLGASWSPLFPRGSTASPDMCWPVLSCPWLGRVGGRWFPESP